MVDHPPRDPAAVATVSERAAAMRDLMFAVSRCDEADARAVLSLVQEDLCDGAPSPAFLGVGDEARAWAALASFDERRAYFFACGERLSQQMLSRRGKIRLARRLLDGMSAEDRAAACSR